VAGADDHFTSAGGEMHLGLVLVREKAGAFEHDVYGMFFPGNFGRVLMCVYFHFFAVTTIEFSVAFTSGPKRPCALSYSAGEPIL